MYKNLRMGRTRKAIEGVPAQKSGFFYEVLLAMREHFSDLHLDFYVNQVLYSGYHQRRQKGSKFLSKMQSTQAQIEDKDETDEGFMFNHFEAELFKDNPPATLPTYTSEGPLEKINMHNRMSETQGLPQRVAAERIEYSTKRVKDLHIRIREQFKANRNKLAIPNLLANSMQDCQPVYRNSLCEYRRKQKQQRYFTTTETFFDQYNRQNLGKYIPRQLLYKLSTRNKVDNPLSMRTMLDGMLSRRYKVSNRKLIRFRV